MKINNILYPEPQNNRDRHVNDKYAFTKQFSRNHKVIPKLPFADSPILVLIYSFDYLEQIKDI